MKSVLREIYSFVTELFETIVTALAIFIVINFFVAQLHQVYGASMYPSFKNGEYLLTDKLTYRFREPVRGEVVIFVSPEAPNKDYIKRVVGLPGESIQIKNNEVLIFNDLNPNGFVLHESYLTKGTITVGKQSIPEGVKIKIPSDSVVVFGDNREYSADSRTWGFVKLDKIIGRSLVRLWPPDAISVIAHADYK